jgi:rhamnopyranosyl-N-acetylglucosaminyl-diphospho-decaprenol beta-1,3/1,4-galactofuranosyltransferase
MEKINIINETCAIVVTYNRKKLLTECLESLIKQSKAVRSIVVVDNASTDDTEGWLLENKYISEQTRTMSRGLDGIVKFGLINYSKNVNELNEPSWINNQEIKIIYLKLSCNSGGAGGFHQGLKLAVELGYEWLWLMDDDGEPDFFCHENIIKYRSENIVINSLVVNKEDHEQLSFEIQNPLTGDLISEKKNVKSCAINGLITGQAHLFNGTFFHRNIVKEAGLPMREMFIWGDEVEYAERLRKLGYSLSTCLSALHYHPRARVMQRKIPLFRYYVNWQDNDLKNYCDIRNRAYINKKYFKKTLIISAIKYLTLFFMTCNFKDLKFWLSAYFDGIAENWGRETEFLNKNS